MNNKNTSHPDPIYSYQPLWGSWKVDSLIGEGSYGKVYKVVREEHGYTYTSAVKIITIPSKEQYREAISSFGDDTDTLKNYFEGMVENILSEINLLYRLRGSPNIVVYEDHMVIRKEDELGWDILIRMEYLTSLPAYLSKNRLNRENVIGLGIDICTAISLCAKNNIIHRDIKDENIFISKDSVFKLGDFGIAKELSKSGKAASFRGTPLFMSPEVFKGEKYDIRSDIYSLGIVMYKLLNKGRIPFMPQYPEKIGYKDSEAAIVKRFSGDAAALPTHSGKELGSIVLKAISYRREDRYSDSTDMRKALQEVLPAMDERLLNEDVTFLTSAKEEKRVDKTISIFVPPTVEKSIVKEEKPPTKKEEKIDQILPTVKEEPHKEPPKPSPPTKPWYKKTWAIATFASVFVIILAGIISILVFREPLPEVSKDAEIIETVVEDGEVEAAAEETSEQEVSSTEDTSASTALGEAAEPIQENENTNEEIAQNEAPTIKLEIIEGPASAEGGSICYYRVKATVTGDPAPTTKFSKDDSNGSLGINVAQVNLNQGQSYTLTASASNAEGEASDAIKLEWVGTESESTTTTAAQKTYNIGDPGPAGGYIFYVNPNYEQVGWRYLEAAPYDQQNGGIASQWYNGNYINIGSIQTSVGSGKSNTEKIIATQGEGNYAAWRCKDISINGYNDWFLPSKDELDLINKNLVSKGIGGFVEDCYWSSSEVDGNDAWGQYLQHHQYTSNKRNNMRVRAVRAFN